MIEYEDIVIELPTAKTLGIAQDISELEVWASGQMFDYTSRTNSATISLAAVALPQHLLATIEGSVSQDGATFNRTNDIEREFAFGFWAENKDGSFNCYWLPVCKLTPTEETYATSTADIPDPESNYSVRVIPYNNLWRVRFSSADAKESGIIVTDKTAFNKKFFLDPIYQESQMQELLRDYRNEVVDASSITFMAVDKNSNKKDDNK